MSLEHPYRKFENTPLWKVVEEAISDLKENRDIEVTTRLEYVIGYICERLAETGVEIGEQVRDVV